MNNESELNAIKKLGKIIREDIIAFILKSKFNFNIDQDKYEEFKNKYSDDNIDTLRDLLNRFNFFGNFKDLTLDKINIDDLYNDIEDLIIDFNLDKDILKTCISFYIAYNVVGISFDINN